MSTKYVVSASVPDDPFEYVLAKYGTPLVGEFQTVDALPHDVELDQLHTDDACRSYDVLLSAVMAGGSKGLCARVAFAVRRSGGVCAVVGTPSVTHVRDAATWSVDVAVAGDVISLRLTDTDADTVTWTWKARYVEAQA